MQIDYIKINQALKSGYRIATFKDKRTSLTLDVILNKRKLTKKAGTILGLPTFYQTPEDLILSKLQMIKVMAPTERALKDKDDVAAILKHAQVNTKVIEKQAQKENTLALFHELTQQRENI